MGSVFGLPLRADDAPAAAAAHTGQHPPVVEQTSADPAPPSGFRFMDADGQSPQLQQRRWRNVRKIRKGKPDSELSADNRDDATADLSVESARLQPRATTGSIAERSASNDLAAPPAAQFRFLDTRPSRVRSRAEAEILSLTIDGARSKTVADAAETVPGFSFADTQPAPPVAPATGASSAEPTPAHPLDASSTIQTAGWEPTRTGRVTESRQHPLLIPGADHSGTPEGKTVTIRQRSGAMSNVASAPGTDVTTQTTSERSVGTMPSAPATTEGTGTTPAAKTATSEPSLQWRPKPAGIVRVASFEPQPTQQSAQTTASNASTRSFSAAAGVDATNRAGAAGEHREDAVAADQSPVWSQAPVVDLTAPPAAPATVPQPHPLDWSGSQRPTDAHQDAWWAVPESRTASHTSTAKAPTAASEDTAGQFPLPFALPPGTEAPLIAAGDVSDADAGDREEQAGLDPALGSTPLRLETQTPYSGARKPSGAAAVPQTGTAYRMGPGRVSRPVPADWSAEQRHATADGRITTSSIELAALLDELQPMPPGDLPLLDVEKLSSPTAADFPAASSQTSDTSAPGDAAEPEASSGGVDAAEQTLGEAPEESDEPLQFLRRQTVLLEPGEHQFDVGISYLNDTSDFPVLLTDGVDFGAVRGQTRQRLLGVPLELRMGVAPYTQAFVNVPFGWSNSEVAFNGSEFTEDEGGIGDISAGVTRQVVVGNQYYPDVLASLAFSAPTGDSSITTALGTPGSGLGQGFWTLTGGLSFIQTYDPLVFFYGLGYTFRFQNEFGDNIEIEPGDQVFYRFGAGFAVNPHVTLSAAFTGSVIGRDKVDGIEIGGSVREPMSIRLAATISRRKGSKTHSSFKLVEPYVNFGLNEDSIDTLVGISWTH